MNKVYFGDNLDIMKSFMTGWFDFVYLDPPFNTGKTQSRTNIKVTKNYDGGGDRIGFNGTSYTTSVVGHTGFSDNMSINKYMAFMEMRLEQIHRILNKWGTMYLHLDYNSVYDIKPICDNIFGRENFINEIIWAYDYGGRGMKTWPKKHDNILMYAKSPDYFFDLEKSDKIEYLSPKLVGQQKAERGKFPTDCWWGTITPTNGKEKVGYATEKPEWLLERLLKVSCPVGGLVLDPFAGSGKIGRVASRLGMEFVLIDNNVDAINIMKNNTFYNRTDILYND